MSETIRLPCGVQAVVEFRPSQDPLLRDSWHVAVRGFMGVVDYDRDSAIKWLNEKCVEARAALLPPGARIVEDTPETRETIARALREHQAGAICWNAYGSQAAAVLKALTKKEN